jgi:hypothetical protein
MFGLTTPCIYYLGLPFSFTNSSSLDTDVSMATLAHVDMGHVR